jgi:hypothetical protein
LIDNYVKQDGRVVCAAIESLLDKEKIGMKKSQWHKRSTRATCLATLQL